MSPAEAAAGKHATGPADDLDVRFDHHPPIGVGVADLHADVRSRCKTLAAQWLRQIPPCRERSLAITALEEAMFWANAGVARHLND